MENFMQGVSLVGAAMILGAYTLLQLGRMGRGHLSFQLFNLVGALLLTFVAVYEGSWGFILLESVWAALSLAGLLRSRKGAGEAGA